MPRSEIVFIEWVGPTLNRVLHGLCQYKREEMKEAAFEACCQTFRVRMEPFTGPVDLVFTAQIPEGEDPYDCTNYGITNKVIEDILVRFDILPDDGPEVVLSTRTDCPVYGETPGMWLQILEADADRVTAVDLYRSLLAAAS